MINKTTCALTLILLVLALGGCGKKEEAKPQEEPGVVGEAPAPAVTPGEMVLIPAGEYIIGSNEKDPIEKQVTNAYPEHKVKLAAFWIGKYEVTAREYLEFSGKTMYQAEGTADGKTWRTFFDMKKPSAPVVYVTVKDAEAYCKSLGERLPTEEEWEAAARGPKGYRFPWGNEWEDNRTNTYEAAGGVPVEIGTFNDVSAFGVHDMFGNVQEWTSTSYKPYKGNPKAGAQEYNMGYTVLKGLSCSYRNGKMTGLWSRAAQYPTYLANFGFRCAKDATPEEAAKAAPAK